MLHRSLRQAQRAALEHALSAHQSDLARVTEAAARLHALRHDCSTQGIPMAERLLSRLRERPAHFDQVFADCALQSKAFDDLAKAFADQRRVPCAGRFAAPALATTLGSASAASLLKLLPANTPCNTAALGKAFSAPIAWALGVGTLSAMVFLHARANLKDAAQAQAFTQLVEQERSQLQRVFHDIDQLRDLTQTQLSDVTALMHALDNAQLPTRYQDLTHTQLGLIGALVNHAHALSALMRRPIGAAQPPRTSHEVPILAVAPSLSRKPPLWSALRGLVVPAWGNRQRGLTT